MTLVGSFFKKQHPQFLHVFQFNLIYHKIVAFLYKNELCDVTSLLGNTEDTISQCQTFKIVHFMALIAEETTSGQKLITRLERQDSCLKP